MILLVLAAGCTPGLGAAETEGTSSARRVRYLMGTRCEAIVHHADPGPAAEAAARALDAIAVAESRLSTWRDDTELAALNAAAGTGPVEVGSELVRFLRDSLRLARVTGGAFDPTVGALVDAWGLREGGRRPTRRELRAARRATGWRHLSLDFSAGRVAFERPGLWVDPGAIGKGWALDRAMEAVRARGARSALLDCGGQVLALGVPPGRESWTISVADPSSRALPAALTLAVRDVSVATSGPSERGITVEGRILGHVLDPRTGRPLSRTGSVTVVAAGAAEADALATALRVMGPVEGPRWVEKNRPGLAAGWLRPGPAGPELIATAGFDRWIEAADARLQHTILHQGESK